MDIENNSYKTLSDRAKEILGKVNYLQIKRFVEKEKDRGTSTQRISWKLNSRNGFEALREYKVSEIKEVVRFVLNGAN